ncbi:MAG: hypothetical protein J4N36_00290 [Chloroflexi bacterium]|nr:hypothetical protein [Chloroflexota bacterium]MCH7953945.1 hypothetical protein [Chloroflexota bacterium]MCI0783186.1 hypothetical protein [Chloroflexota bacterium]MCI0814718.1 hypothetical protein [Chloroflexota bacterium]MCI0816842.1 hypothetical protein [Chloroflexota bacterium]
MAARKSAARVRDFYAAALTDAERLQLAEARRVDGLDEEIALLRVRLRSALEQRPEDFDLLRDGIALLVRAVSTQYRLSPKARKDLANRMAAVLNSIGDQILPADGGGK